MWILCFPLNVIWGFFSHGVCSAAPELLFEKHLQTSAALLSVSSLQWERGGITGGGTVLPRHHRLQRRVECVLNA